MSYKLRSVFEVSYPDKKRVCMLDAVFTGCTKCGIYEYVLIVLNMSEPYMSMDVRHEEGDDLTEKDMNDILGHDREWKYLGQFDKVYKRVDK